MKITFIFKKILNPFLLLTIISMPLTASYQKMNTEDLVDKADIILKGTVIEKNTSWDDHKKNIYTTINIKVDEWLKPIKSESFFELKVIGGKVGEIEQVVTDMPLFQPGEKVFLFIRVINENIIESYFVIGGFQGKLDIKNEIVVSEQMSESDFTQMIKEFLVTEKELWLNIRSKYNSKVRNEIRGLKAAPIINNFTPASASGGTGIIMTIAGSNFGSTQGTGSVRFTQAPPDRVDAPIISWSDTEIKCLVPQSASSGTILVTNNQSESAETATNFALSYGFGGAKWGGSSPAITYEINANTPDITGTNEYAAITAALSEWNNAGANFSFIDGGATSNSSVANDGVNLVFWGSVDGAGGILAVNTYWYYYDAGTIIESDIKFDDDETWSLNPISDQYDVQSVAIHELGHTYSFYDYYHSDDSQKIMYGYSSSGTTKRSLTVHEIQGAKDIYGYSGQVNAISGGNWLQLSENSDYAQTPDIPQLDLGLSDQDMTIDAWIYPTSTPASGSFYVIAAKSNFIANRSYELVFNSNRRIEFRLSANGNSVTTLTSTASGTGVIPLNAWTHVRAILTNDVNDDMLILINGNFNINNWGNGFAGDVFNSSSPFVVGGYSGGSEFVGRIDEVRLSSVGRWIWYDTEHALPCSYSTDANTSGFWKFNEPNSSRSFADHSANGNKLLTTSGGDISLPVELSSFTASIIGSVIRLSWITETEINNYGFEIERKVSSGQSSVGNSTGSDFEKIGFVNGNGNSNSPKIYYFLDDNVSSENPAYRTRRYFYRLKQIDNDGKFKYSSIVEIDFGNPTEYSLEQNYPNPFNPSTSIQYAIGSRQFVQLKVYDVLGNEIATLVNEEKEPGIYETEFNPVSSIKNPASGIYFYQLKAGNYLETKKMILMK